MTPFKLPDLVLGVRIVADTSGAKKAGRDLQRAVNQGIGGPGGGGGRGGGFGGTFGGSLLGTMLGGGGGTTNITAAAAKAGSRHIVDMLAGGNAGAGLKMGRWAQDKRLKLGKPASSAASTAPLYLAEGYASYGAWARARRPPPIPRLAATNISGIRGSNYGVAQNTALWNKTLAAQTKTAAKSMAAATKSTIAKGVGSRTASSAMSVGMMTAMSRGNITGVLLRFGRMFWPLLIVALGYMIFSKLVLPAVKTAFGYIRKSGVTGGQFGEFGQQASMTPVLLKNVEVQFGLMCIQLMDLGSILENLNLILMRVSGTFAWLGESKILKFLTGTSAAIINPQAWKFLELLSRFLPGTPGGKDLGTGSTGRLGGAFLEGSVEAYRTIQGTITMYAAQTARNTKAISDDMKKVLQRGQDMGVVVG